VQLDDIAVDSDQDVCSPEKLYAKKDAEETNCKQERKDLAVGNGAMVTKRKFSGKF
jgi:hypothetical protein